MAEPSWVLELAQKGVLFGALLVMACGAAAGLGWIHLAEMGPAWHRHSHKEEEERTWLSGKELWSGWGVSPLLLLVTGHASGAPGAPGNEVPAPIERTAKRLIAELSRQGYEVSRGYFRLYTEDDCADSYATMKSCFGNNPAAPDVLFAVPPWPGEFVDPATKLALGQVLEGYNTSFRLDPREAIVIFGRLPPQAAYFGEQTYLFTREGTYDTDSDTYKFLAKNYPDFLHFLFATVPENPKRIQLLASLSNSNNNVVIERQSGAAFDKTRAIIVTPDRLMDHAIREAFDAVSVRDANIFTEPIPNTIRLGLEEEADELLNVIRYAEPQDGGAPGTASDTWRQDLPLVVLRVRDTRPDRLPEPYGPPVLEARTAADESGLKADLLQLVAEVNSRWGQPCAERRLLRSGDQFRRPASPAHKPGRAAMHRDWDELPGGHPGHDLSDHPNLPLDGGEIYAVVGTLGTETGNATYVGLSVNDSLLLKGVENISSDQLRGTALDYAGTVNNADKFYVYYLARDCSTVQDLTGGHCFSISPTAIPLCSRPGSPDCHYLKIIQREYIRQGTQRGPDSTLTLAPRLIKFWRVQAYLPMVYGNDQ